MPKSKSKAKVVRCTPAPAAPIAEVVRGVLNANNTTIPRQALSIAEAGQVAGVTKATIRKEIERGRLAAFRVGDRKIRIAVNALDKYLKERAAAGVYPIPGGNRRKQIEAGAA